MLTKVSAASDPMASTRPFLSARGSVWHTLGPVFAPKRPLFTPFFLSLGAQWGHESSTPTAKRQIASRERFTTTTGGSTVSLRDGAGMGWGGSLATSAHWRASAGQASRKRSRLAGRTWLGVPASSAIWVALWESIGRAPLRSCRDSRLQASVIRRSQESDLRSAGRRRGVPGPSSNRWPGVMGV